MSLCEVPKCAAETHAAGLCLKHYMRVRRHGAVDGGRNGDGRVKSAHPMWEAWKSMLRAARQQGGYDSRWNDFWLFLEDVGSRPEGGGRLYRTDRSQPFSKENVTWKKPISDVNKLKDQTAWQRAWRAKKPESGKRFYLKRHYGITLERYNELSEAQGGVCAICKQPERNIHAQTGEVMTLAVDHDHATGRMRGLLCTKCNTGLGNFNDSTALLHAAIAYLQSHEILEPV